eukprot:scaffold269_cov123-Isochrysis_galbana.AAC.10
MSTRPRTSSSTSTTTSGDEKWRKAVGCHTHAPWPCPRGCGAWRESDVIARRAGATYVYVRYTLGTHNTGVNTNDAHIDMVCRGAWGPKGLGMVYNKMYSFELFTLQSLHTPETGRGVGPEELKFARVGGGRPDLAEGIHIVVPRNNK